MKRILKSALIVMVLTAVFMMGSIDHSFALITSNTSFAHCAESVALPAPDKTGGKPLMEALALRQTSREFSAQDLSEQDISNLLWATWGVNRPDGKRTAPTAKNTQAVNLYVALKSGVHLYDGINHRLQPPIIINDVRPMFNNAPLVLIYAAPADDYTAGMHVGSLYQNAGLYCASAGLSNVIKQTGADALKDELKLPEGYRFYVIHEVGLPK